MKYDVPESVRVKSNRKVVQGGLGGPLLMNEDREDRDIRTVREERRKRGEELKRAREAKP